MIYGIGIDIVNIERMQKAVEKWGDRFLQRVFSRGEIAYCFEKRNPYLSLSVRFAAKEAFIKALGAPVAVSLSDIEVMNNDKGKPSLRVKGAVEDLVKDNSIHGMHVSLSHEKEYGIACVVLER